MKPGNAIALTKKQQDELQPRLVTEKNAGVPVQRVDLVDPHQRAPLFLQTPPRGPQ